MFKSKEEEEETYSIELICKNCNEYEQYEIICGIIVEDFCKNSLCNNCKCKGFLKKDNSIEED